MSFRMVALNVAALLGGYQVEAQLVQAAPTFVSQSYALPLSTGLRRTERFEKLLAYTPVRSYADSEIQVPGKADLSASTGPVEMQGHCGSCYDFALIATLRGTLKLRGRDPGRLSFNYLLNCAQPYVGCGGDGDFMAADYLLEPKGVPPYGADGPYNAKQGECIEAPAVASAKAYTLLGTRVHKTLSPTFKDIAYAIGVLHKPVAVDVATTPAFKSYSAGIFNLCTEADPSKIDHMVVVEGYDCESSVNKDQECAFDAEGNLPPGIGTWIIRNSWSDAWGNHGYVRMKATSPKGDRCNQIGFDALTFDVGD